MPIVCLICDKPCHQVHSGHGVVSNCCRGHTRFVNDKVYIGKGVEKTNDK